MADDGIYRNVALEQLSTPERLDEYISVASSRAWLGVVAAAIALAAAGTWAFAGAITERVTATAIVRPVGGIRVVTSPGDGTIADLPVAAGSLVRQGAVIAVVQRSDSSLIQVRAARDGRIAEISVAPGAFAHAGDRLLVLGSTADSSEALAYVRAADASRLRVGMPVTIRASGASGYVADVADAPASRAAISAALGNDVVAGTLAKNAPVVAVRVALARGARASGGTPTPAEIVVARRRPVDLLLP